MTRRCAFLTATVTILLFSPGLFAGGLSTNLGEVLIQNLGTGESYCLKNLANVTLSVVNRGEDTVSVRATPEVPDTVELRHSAEPIPSAAWIRIETDSMVLAPGQMGVSDVCIDVPPDSTLRGRKFQVMLWSRTLPRPGDFIACGLKSRVLFTIAAEADSSAAGQSPDDRESGAGSSTRTTQQSAKHTERKR
ncbi:MAG: hypothetical protein JW952_00300 [Candidatus Eisenbacteria bacterium]|nr:hypothetical protein [Candidatus Eisenbacteria bacterium]